MTNDEQEVAAMSPVELAASLEEVTCCPWHDMVARRAAEMLTHFDAAAIRKAALEEAARACEDSLTERRDDPNQGCADLIRALSDQAPS